jgi:hypothetical protein
VVIGDRATLPFALQETDGFLVAEIFSMVFTVADKTKVIFGGFVGPPKIPHKFRWFCWAVENTPPKTDHDSELFEKKPLYKHVLFLKKLS